MSAWDICSFCGTSEKDGRILARASSALICDQCTGDAAEVMLEKDRRIIATEKDWDSGAVEFCIRNLPSGATIGDLLRLLGERSASVSLPQKIRDNLEDLAKKYNFGARDESIVGILREAPLKPLDTPKIEMSLEELSGRYGVGIVNNLDEITIDPHVLQLIPQEVARRHALIPIEQRGSTIVVAIADPSNIYAQDDIKFLTGCTVEVRVAEKTAIEKAIERHYTEGFPEMFGGDDESSLALFDPTTVVFDEADQAQARRKRHARSRRGPRRLLKKGRVWKQPVKLLRAIIDYAIDQKWSGCCISAARQWMEDDHANLIILEPYRHDIDGKKIKLPGCYLIRYKGDSSCFIKAIQMLLALHATKPDPNRAEGVFTVLDVVTNGKRGKRRPRYTVTIVPFGGSNHTGPFTLSFNPLTERVPPSSPLW